MARIEAEATNTPLQDVLLGYGPVAVTCAGTAAMFLAGPAARGWLIRLLVVWSGSILCFLGGVRRGTAFYTEGGPFIGELATMLWVFFAGLVALVAQMPGVEWFNVSLAVLSVGYASVAVLDHRGAQRGEAPAFFAHLRPIQMLVAAACFVVLLVTGTV